MKKVKLLVGAISLGLFFTSCDSDGHDHPSDHHNQTEQMGHEEHKSQNNDNESKSLRLNDGKKWKVNTEMMMPINTMKTQIESFLADGQNDYAKLSENLNVEINKLTSSCTMTGESHDQLHLWLLPYIQLVKDLKDEKGLQDVQQSMQLFHQYFE